MSIDIEHSPKPDQTLRHHWDDVIASVDWFAGRMEMKFEDVHHKGHWQFVEWEYLHERLWTEYEELRKALDDGEPSEGIIRECVDVANCALMLADWWRTNS